jgi:5'-nucleotidase/UDP-sugar diphosphatase
MKNRLLLSVLLGVAAVVWLCTAAAAQSDTLVILHTNDTHSHLLSYGPKDGAGDWTWGGMARIATLVGMNRMGGGKVMLLDAGDFSIGDFMFQKYLSIPELSIMKGLGYDAIALGNHEFDLYPSTLAYELQEAGYPDPATAVLCANLDLTGYPVLENFIKPYTIKEYGGLKIGIVGLLTESANQLSNPSPVVVRPALGEAQAWVDTLTDLGCDLVVVLSHLGYDYDQLLASQVTGIDVIVGGHSHTEVAAPVQIGNTMVVQAKEFGRYLGKLTLYLDNEQIESWDYQLLPVDASVPPEPTTAGMIGYLAAGVEADPRFGPVYTETVAEAAVDITKPLPMGLFKDTPLGNMVADAFRAETGTDIALQPQGFCSQTIYEGQVRGADIWQAIPYGFDEASGLGFKLATFTTDGMSLMAGLEFAVYNLPYAEDFLLHSSNMSYAYNSINPPGARVDYGSIRINGSPINPMGTYTVTTSDGVVGFISQIPDFHISDLVITDDFVYTVAKDYMIARSPVSYYTEGRVIDLAVYADPVAGAAALSEVVNQYLAIGAIDNRGIANSLLAKLGAVRRALLDGNSRAAHNVLVAFNNHVHAQSGKHISPEAAETLMYLAGNLMDVVGAMPQANQGAGSTMANVVSTQQAGQVSGSAIAGMTATLQNFPNPFNPTTVISFTLPVGVQVRLEVFNLLGQRVRSVVDEYLEAGYHAVEWNSTDDAGARVASGIYLYRLTAGDVVASKKMVLLK